MAQGGHRLNEGRTERGQFVVHARRNGCGDLAFHQAVAFHGAQGLGEDLGGDALNHRLELTKAGDGLLGERRNNERGPPVGEVAHHGAGGAGVGEDVGGLVILRGAGGGGERGGHSCGLFNLLRGCYGVVVRGAKNIFKYFHANPLVTLRYPVSNRYYKTITWNTARKTTEYLPERNPS